MANRMPRSWSAHAGALPVLKEVERWEPLRRWPLSEVYRIHLRSGRSMIAKRGRATEARELQVYTDVLVPLGVRAPQLHAAHEDETGSIMLLQDLGPLTVNDDPRPAYFLEAAGHLARMRLDSITRLSANALRSDVYRSHYLSQQRLLDDLIYISRRLAQLSPDLKSAFDAALAVVPRHIARLYGDIPATLVHNDYHIKNLVLHDGTVTPIDWPGAHVSPHLGDLYTLLTEAADHDIAHDSLVQAYVSELDSAPGPDIEWQINVGGACWLVRTLRWILDVGAPAVPAMRTWIPGLASDLGNLAENLG